MQPRTSAHAASKRLLRACAECARRKIRCDRRRPCRPCLQRNRGRDCLDISRENSDAEASEVELSLLRARVAELEGQLSGHRYLSNSSEPIGDDQSFANDEVSQQELSEAGQTPQQELETLHNAFEDFNLGIRPEGGTPVESFLSPRAHTSQQLWLLPSQNTSLKIIKFSINELGWIHCALQASVFLKEHQDFWTSFHALDHRVLSQHSWFATYFAVLAVGIYYMDLGDDCFRDFSFLDPESQQLPPRSLQESASLAKQWYRASLHELEISDFLGKSKLSSVQTIAILPLLNASFGETEREWLTMGAAINMARSLHMHKLGKEQSLNKSATKTLWSIKENRALGRRLWWTICICDWLGNMNRPTSIAPRSSMTEMESGIDDQDISLENPHAADCPSSQMSLLDYHQTIAKLATILELYVKDGRGSHGQNLASAMRAVEEIYNSCPPHLRITYDPVQARETAPSCHHHRWANFQHYLFTHTIQFMRLTIARSSLSEWILGKFDRYDFHATAIEAAEIIVQEKARDVSQMFRKSWIVCASTVAAGVILALDLLCCSDNRQTSLLTRRRTAIQTCISALESLQATNAISKGGPEVLKRLLALEATWDHSTAKSHATLRSIVKHVTTRKDSMEQTLETQTTSSAFLNLDPDFLETPTTAEWTTGSPDAFDGIFVSAINEIDMFENPFEVDDRSFFTGRYGM